MKTRPRRILIAVLALAALVGAAYFYVFSADPGQSISIADVTQAQTLRLKKRYYQGYVVSLAVSGTGSIVGTAEIQWMNGKEVYLKREIGGPVHFTFAPDWYSDSAEIRYVPKSVSGGTLTLIYSFISIKPYG